MVASELCNRCEHMRHDFGLKAIVSFLLLLSVGLPIYVVQNDSDKAQPLVNSIDTYRIGRAIDERETMHE